MSKRIRDKIEALKIWAKLIKREAVALALACKHPCTPWYAKAVAAAVVAYALSPIDLIPDFIPIFGYVDDLLLLPLGIMLALKLIPPDVMSECREGADRKIRTGGGRIAARVIITIWLAVLAAAAYFIIPLFFH